MYRQDICKTGSTTAFTVNYITAQKRNILKSTFALCHWRQRPSDSFPSVFCIFYTSHQSLPSHHSRFLETRLFDEAVKIIYKVSQWDMVIAIARAMQNAEAGGFLSAGGLEAQQAGRKRGSRLSSLGFKDKAALVPKVQIQVPGQG